MNSCKRVEVIGVNTTPHTDPYLNPPQPTKTEFWLDLEQYRCGVRQTERSCMYSVREHNRLRWCVCLHGWPEEEELREFLEGSDAQVVMSALCDRLTTYSDGQSTKGRVADEAWDFWYEFVRLLQGVPGDYWGWEEVSDWFHYTEWRYEDWMQEGDPPNLLACSDDDIWELTKRIEEHELAEARTVMIGSLYDYLLKRRDEYATV